MRQRDLDVVVGEDPALTVAPAPHGLAGTFGLNGALVGGDPVRAGEEFDPIRAFETLDDRADLLDDLGRVGVFVRQHELGELASGLRGGCDRLQRECFVVAVAEAGQQAAFHALDEVPDPLAVRPVSALGEVQFQVRLQVVREVHELLDFQVGGARAPTSRSPAPRTSDARGQRLHAAFGDGLNEVSHRFHRYLRSRPQHPRTSRPVLINTWEAAYFDHDLPRLLELAEFAADAGAERFVLDDGWFLGRRHDSAGLGDWFVDPAVWPNGLKPLTDRVDQLGMQFGLWVEPEMINLDSDLARAHPEWIFRAGGREGIATRQQHVLDLGNPQAYAYIAGEVKQFFKITVPLLRPVLVLVLITSVTGSFQVFDTVAVTSKGGPANASNVIQYYIVDQAFNRSHFGYGAAVSVLLFVILIVVALVQFRVLRGRESDLA